MRWPLFFSTDPPDLGDTAVTQQILETADAICRELGYRQVIKLTPPDVPLAETGLYWTKTDSADGDDTHILIHAGPDKAELLADGRLFDARLHGLGLDEVTRQHFRIPVTASDDVIALLHRAVPSDWPNDYKGVWADILGMCISGGRDVGPTERLFTVIIRGVGRRRYWSFRAEVNSSESGAPFLYIGLADEPRKQRTLFPLGHIVMTPGAAALHVDFAPYLTRHGLVDWGELCDYDAEQNDKLDRIVCELLTSSGRMPSGSARTIASLGIGKKFQQK